MSLRDNLRTRYGPLTGAAWLAVTACVGLGGLAIGLVALALFVKIEAERRPAAGSSRPATEPRP